MYVLGLTGGVGSGKTEAARLLKKLTGAELLLADELGHQVMEPGQEGFKKIVAHFGEEILSVDGSIDRDRLSAHVFSSPEQLEVLNQIVHPAVLSYIQDYIQKKTEKKGLLIVESAIMFESGCDKLCDEVWYVFVSKKIREKRLQESRGYSEEKTASIIKKQMEEEEYRKRCSREIKNDGTLEALEKSLEKLLLTAVFSRIFEEKLENTVFLDFLQGFSSKIRGFWHQNAKHFVCIRC